MPRPSERLQIRGVIGQIKYGYYTAAAVHGYTVTRDKETKVWSLVATVVQADAFKMKQRPLRFVAPHKKGAWEWVIVQESLVLNHGTVRCTLTPIEELVRT